MYYLGIDLGGTNIAAGVIDMDYNMIAKSVTKTVVTGNPEDICDQISAIAGEAAKKAGISFDELPWIGIGTPGTIDRENGRVKFSNNLRFKDVELKKLVEAKTGKTVIIENDANAAAYGEYLAGVLRGARNAVAITIGTGIGSGIIIDGKLYNATNCAGGEIGHTVIAFEGRQCTCGRRGCWDAYASATALVVQTKEAMQRCSHRSALWQIAGDLENVNSFTAFEAMRRGDPDAENVVNQYIKYLGCGLANCVNIFQPDILCIGGGICNEGDFLLKPLRAYIDRECATMNVTVKSKICRAELGNDAGIIGAALLGKRS